MNSGKAGGIDSITVELLEANIETPAAVLEDLFNSIRDDNKKYQTTGEKV